LVGAEYLASFPTITDQEGKQIADNVISALVELSKFYGLFKEKRAESILHMCKDIQNIWEEASREESAQQFLEYNLEPCLEVLEGLNKEKGDYFYGKQPLAVDYYAFALVQLLKHIYGKQVTEMIAKKPRLVAWLNIMKDRQNISNYLNRERKFPILSWHFSPGRE